MAGRTDFDDDALAVPGDRDGDAPAPNHPSSSSSSKFPSYRDEEDAATTGAESGFVGSGHGGDGDGGVASGQIVVGAVEDDEAAVEVEDVIIDDDDDDEGGDYGDADFRDPDDGAQFWNERYGRVASSSGLGSGSGLRAAEPASSLPSPDDAILDAAASAVSTSYGGGIGGTPSSPSRSPYSSSPRGGARHAPPPRTEATATARPDDVYLDDFDAGIPLAMPGTAGGPNDADMYSDSSEEGGESGVFVSRGAAAAKAAAFEARSRSMRMVTTARERATSFASRLRDVSPSFDPMNMNPAFSSVCVKVGLFVALVLLAIAIAFASAISGRNGTDKNGSSANNYAGEHEIERLYEPGGPLFDYNDRGSMLLESSAFGHGEPIPSQYTADGRDDSPPLRWSNVPRKAKSLVLLVDDHVKAGGKHGVINGADWAHWVAYDIPPSAEGLREGIPPDPVVNLYEDDGDDTVRFRQGLNSWEDGSHGYKGPDPSRKTGLHYYAFAVFALDGMLGLDPSEADMNALVDAMAGRKVLGWGKLVGTYQRFFDD